MRFTQAAGVALLLAAALCVALAEAKGPKVDADADFDAAAAGGGAEVADPTVPAAVKGKAASTFSGATVNSIMMTIATELGDKTFCIAAVMAMRYNRLFVFAGGIGALLVMTVLSVGIGVAVPTLLPKVYTHYAAAALFAYFGVKLLKEAREMTIAGTGGSNEELAEAEEELGFSAKEEKGAGGAAATAPAGGASSASGGLASVDIEAGVSSAAASGSSGGGVTARPRKGDASGAEPPSPGLPSPTGGAIVPLATGGASSSSSSAGASSSSASSPGGSGAGSAGSAAAAGALGSLMTLASVSLAKDWAILTQAFSITFLAEWGDRSQIATIAMAAAQNAYGVCIGAFIGHSLCTGLAVIGGRMLASRISERTVAWMGGVLFLLFAVHSLIFGPDVDE